MNRTISSLALPGRTTTFAATPFLFSLSVTPNSDSFARWSFVTGHRAVYFEQDPSYTSRDSAFDLGSALLAEGRNISNLYAEDDDLRRNGYTEPFPQLKSRGEINVVR